jgi:hypothetical protein
MNYLTFFTISDKLIEASVNLEVVYDSHTYDDKGSLVIPENARPLKIEGIESVDFLVVDGECEEMTEEIFKAILENAREELI